ncbi:PilN domain-containing protein [Candidatus Hydrogenedentota bacterium]
MININLLPEHLRPIERNTLPYHVLLILSGVAFLFIFISAINVQIEIGKKKSELQRINSDIQLLDTQLEEVKELDDRKTNLAAQVSAINKILKGRRLWAPRLAALAKVIPLTTWIEDFEETEGESWVVKRTKTKDKETGKTKVKNTVVTKKFPALVMEGYTYPKVHDQGVDELGQLIASFKNPAAEAVKYFKFRNFEKLVTDDDGGRSTSKKFIITLEIR